MIQRIEHNGILYSLIIRGNFESDKKYKFFTEESSFLQLGTSSYKKGEKITNHLHLPRQQVVTRTEEVIFLQKGRMKVSIFDESKNLLHEDLIQEGDIIYLMRGGHGFEPLSECQIFEVKQGPYVSRDIDKILF